VALVEQLIARRRDLLLVRTANANQAIELARTERPEVILLDTDLPGLGGDGGAIAFLQLLRAPTVAHSPPVLALSANAEPAATVKALEAGFFLCLAKPLQAAPFIDALAYALEFAALERAEQP